MTKVDESSCLQLDEENDNHDSFNSPFECLLHYEQENTMQYLGNGVLDSLFNFKKLSDSDVQEFTNLINEKCSDKLFNSLIIKLFNRECNAYVFKSSLQDVSTFPLISLKSAQDVLNDVFKSTQNIIIREFILFVTFSLEKAFNDSVIKFKELGIYNGAFFNFFIERCLKIVQKVCTNENNKGLTIHGNYCLLSFICQNDNSDGALPGKIKYFNISIDYSQCKSFNDVWKQLVSNFDALFPSKTQGFDINGSFENSVKMMAYIAPVWDGLSATFNLRKNPLPVSMNGMSGGSRIPDSDIVKIFAGDYSLIPYDESYSNDVNVDVISNFSSFNQLSNGRKLQVSHFLLSNRKRFNDILGEATQIVMNGLNSKLNSAYTVNVLKSGRFTPTHARNVGLGMNNEVEEDSVIFANKLKAALDKASPKSFDQAVNFIVHSYIPMLSQFENRCSQKFGASESRSILNNYVSDNFLNVIGVASLIDTNYSNLSLSGGKSLAPKIVEKRVEVPVVKKVVEKVPVQVVKEVEVPVQVVKEVPIVEEVNMVEGGSASSSSSLVNSLIDGQKRFNKSYEEIYRRLISAVNAVSITNVQGQGFSKLYSICSQLSSIAIKSNKTTSYISGFYGAKNYNRLYTACVENAINAINNSGASGFSDVVKVLEDLKLLLINTAKEVQDLRTKFISAPKEASEMLIVAGKNIKQPCNLDRKDFNALDEAIGRIINTIRNYSSESGLYNTKQQIESYVSKIEDRSKVINEHYEQKITGIKNVFVTLPNRPAIQSRERDYARDAWISLYNQTRDCMLYLNQVVDTKLAKERADNLRNSNLSSQQIETIERAFLAFKNAQITTEFRREMEKLSKVFESPSAGILFKLIKRLKKLISKSQYINFLSQLYRELHIFNSEFNWNEFNDKITNLIVLSSIRIQPIYVVNGNQQLTEEGIIHELSSRFERNFNRYKSRYMDNNSWPERVDNAAYNFVHDYLTILSNSRSNKLTDAVAGTMVMDLFTEYSKMIPEICTRIDNECVASGVNPVIQNGIGVLTDNTPLSNNAHPIIVKFENMLKLNANANPPQPITVFKEAPANNLRLRKTNVASSLDALLLFDAANTPIQGGGALSTALVVVINVLMTLIGHYEKEIKVNQNEFPGKLPYHIAHLPLFTNALFGAIANNNEFSSFLNSPIKPTEYFGVSITTGESELNFAKIAIESLFANVLAVVDKYWSIKYSGTLPLPLNLSAVLRGGSKQDGGTVFDSSPLHDYKFSSVIPEAVPFYLCAFNICHYYITTFNIKESGDSSIPQLSLNINKISLLYPISEIFGKYQASLDSLTPVQIKTALAVFNEIWNQAQGNEAAKLSRSIDILFNELNACFIFTDKLQLEIIKSTNSLSKASIDIIDDRIITLIEYMKNTMNKSVIESNENPETQAKRFEKILNDGYNRIKNEPETQRLAVLKSLLSKHDTVGGMSEYYKFMELVISPLLISAKSYIQIFSLFDNYSFESEQPLFNSTIDFRNCFISFKDPLANNGKGRNVYDSIWNVIQLIFNKSRPELKAVLIEHPIVLAYNKLLLYEALDSLHKTGAFVLPKFWIVLDENTYPTKPKRSFKVENEYHMNDNVVLMRQIWPTVKAKTIADYYNHCVTEFISDYDHFVHNFISYPGLSDRTIKQIVDAAHESIKINNVGDDASNDEKFKTTEVYSLQFAESEMLRNASHLKNIPVNKSNYYIYPPPYPLKALIPRYNDLTPVEEIELTEYSTHQDESNHPVNNVRVDGCGIYINSRSAGKDKITGCEYTWVDWAIFHLAKCDKTSFCLPYKLLLALQDYPSLGNYLRIPGYRKQDNSMQYNRMTDGVYNNIITQNIIARSSSSSNKEKMEYSSLNSSWVAGLVAATPYLINTLFAYKESMSQDVVYNRNPVNQCLSNLIDALTVFYDDVSNYAPFMSFMTNSVHSTRTRPHAFAELLTFINNNNLSDMDSADMIKLEWANMYFFNGLENISFPDYKNKDRFEWIKTFAKDKIENDVFSAEFSTTVQTLARNTWAGLIAKTADYNNIFKNAYHELDEIIINIINIMSECDADIIQKYIGNIVDNFSLHIKRGIAGHGLSGGNEVNETESFDIPKDRTDLHQLLSNLTKGLIATNTVAEQIDPRNNPLDENDMPNADNIAYYCTNLPGYLLDAINDETCEGDLSVLSYDEIINNSVAYRMVDNSLKSVIPNNFLYKILKNVENCPDNKIAKFNGKSSIVERIKRLEKELKSDLADGIRYYLPDGPKSKYITNFINKGPYGHPMELEIQSYEDGPSTAREFLNLFQACPSIKYTPIRLRGAINQCTCDFVSRRMDNSIEFILNDTENPVHCEMENAERGILYYNVLANLMIWRASKFIFDIYSFVIESEDLVLDGAEKYKPLVIDVLTGIYVGIIVKFNSAVNNIFNENDREQIDFEEEDYGVVTEWINRKGYMDSYQKIMKVLYKTITLPIFNGTCDELLFKMIGYFNHAAMDPVLIFPNVRMNDLANRYAHPYSEDELENINLDYDMAVLYIASMAARVMHTIARNATSYGATPELSNSEYYDLNNAYLNFYTTIDTLTQEGYVVNVPTIAQSLSSNYTFLKSTGRLTLSGGSKSSLSGGGFYSNDGIEVIYAVANGIAKSINNRAVYIDSTQSLDNSAVIFDAQGSVASPKTYLYKFLYNPNLCTLFNKSTYNNVQYAIANVSFNRLFINDPIIKQRFNPIDINRVRFRVSKEYADCNLPDGILGAINPAANITAFYLNNWRVSSRATQRRTINHVHDDYSASNINNTFLNGYRRRGWAKLDGTPININNLPQQLQQVMGAANIGPGFGNINQFNPQRLKANYDNSATVIAPKVHTIKLDDKMFRYIPYTKMFEQHLFSPQKDIYNATLTNIDKLASPTIITNNYQFVDFVELTQTMAIVNQYNQYVGNPPTFGNVLTNYHNFHSNPIYTFIEKLIQTSLSSIINKEASIKIANLGFDVGRASLSGHGLLGGFNIQDNISKSFVNMSGNSTGVDEFDILSSLYGSNAPENDNEVDDRDHDFSNGIILYRHLFKFGGGELNDSSKMVSLILNYFHKFNVSFNSMFNQLCFPSLIFNSSALRLAMTRLADVVGNAFPDGGNGTGKSKVFKAVQLYLKNYTDGDASVLDKSSDYRLQINFNSEGHKQNTSLAEVIEALTNANPNARSPDFGRNKVLWFANQYSAPSIANNFITELLKYTDVNNPVKKSENVNRLFPTGICSALRHMDSLTTYINVVFMLLRLTSYYDHDYERDMTFFNVPNPEPFSVE